MKMKIWDLNSQRTSYIARISGGYKFVNRARENQIKTKKRNVVAKCCWWMRIPGHCYLKMQGPSKWNFALLSAGKAPQWSKQFALTVLLLRSWPHHFLVSSHLKTWKCRPLSRLTLHQKVRNEAKPCFPSPSVNRGSALIWFYIIPAALELSLLCLLIVSSHYVNWHPPLPSRICVNFRRSSTRSFFSSLIIICLCFVSCSRS